MLFTWCSVTGARRTGRPYLPPAPWGTAIALLVLSACDIADGGGSHRLTAPGSAAGYRVATDGPTAIVGAFKDAASVYSQTSDGWDRVAELRPSGLTGDNNFGWAAAVEDNIAVIANPTEGGTFEAPRGAVYVFERQGGTWVQTARLVPTGLTLPRLFGRAVAVSGGQILVGVGRVRGTGFSTEPNVVQVFEKSGQTWALVQTVVPPDPERSASFGESIAADGDVAVLGASEREPGTFGDADGSAVVLRRRGSEWTTEAVLLEPDGPGSTGFFAISVAVDGDMVVVGAPATTVDGVDSAGIAFVYRRSGGMWVQAGRVLNPEPSERDFFAMSVGIEGETIVAGSEAEDRGRGAVFTFEQSGGSWVVTNRLSEDVPPSSTFGAQVALRGGTLLVGAPYDGDGAAYAYRRSGGVWTP